MTQPLALIIEDQPHLAILYEDTLRLVGYDVFSIHNGLEALNHLAIHPSPDFVILDVNLPSLSGRDILKHIRSNAKYDDMPVLVLTANVLMIQQIQPEIGENDYLHAKPIGMMELQSYAKKARHHIKERAESRLETQPTQVIRENEDVTPSEVILPDDTIQDVKALGIADKDLQAQEHKVILTPDDDSITLNDEDEALE